MNNTRAGWKRLPGVAMVLAALVLSSCQQCPLCCHDGADEECGTRARVCKEPTVRALAEDVDTLERHIERYGSVSAQVPSVWGQARLTKHREDYEKVMLNELSGFTTTLQGSLYRSDQAVLANALMLSNVASQAASGGGGSSTAVASASSANAPAGLTSTDAAGVFGGFNLNRTPVVGTPTVVFPSGVTARGGSAPSDSGGKSASGEDKGGASKTASADGKTAGSITLDLEPTVRLDEQSRYLNHLNELRRINEGDDTADSPGYALNLVRVPVTVLPGRHTEQGFGAEVTMTLRPNLSDELLPTTYRNLVLNDLLDQISVPMTELLNDNEIRAVLEKSPAPEDFPPDPATTPDRRSRRVEHLIKNVQASTRARRAMANPRVSVPSTWMRNARRAFPPSQLIEVYGEAESLTVLDAAYQVMHKDIANKYFMHFPDVQNYLEEELHAAYDFLAHPANADLWTFCNPDLVAAVRSRQVEHVKAMHCAFRTAAGSKTGRPGARDVTVALAWAVLVESALLNDQLIQDMKESASLRGCPCLAGDWVPYFLPSPPPEARHAFNDYVRCRWPIHVFALDPVTQQQNIADIFSQRREMQMALSLAFVSGNMSANNFLRYARRLEMDIETISLNHTVVGFSHGDDTFGWRFYPRFQTPDVEGNATVIFRDLLLGGPRRDALLRQRRLEPGQRECIAVVIMPSFVPYATLDVTGNWFSLTNPKVRELTAEDAVQLGARVKAIQNCAGSVGDAECYRDGDLERLIRRARQLEKRLPMQTLSVQVPYENTLGGFAMFNTGLTDLAPELFGWYGAPGLNLDAPTSLFLIGNHFSVHQTRVVVGGKEIGRENQELLSRQVMKITVPPGGLATERHSGRIRECAPPIPGGKEGTELFVDVHVATPYGVSSHLLVPACETGKAPGPAWETTLLKVSCTDKMDGKKKVGIGPPTKGVTYEPDALQISLGSLAVDPDATASLSLTLKGPGGTSSIYLEGLKTVARKHALTINKDNGLTALLEQLFVRVGPWYKDVSPGANPISVVHTNVVLLKGQDLISSGPLENSLTISWMPVESVAPAPPARRDRGDDESAGLIRLGSPH